MDNLCTRPGRHRRPPVVIPVRILLFTTNEHRVAYVDPYFWLVGPALNRINKLPVLGHEFYRVRRHDDGDQCLLDRGTDWV